MIILIRSFRASSRKWQLISPRKRYEILRYRRRLQMTFIDHISMYNCVKWLHYDKHHAIAYITTIRYATLSPSLHCSWSGEIRQCIIYLTGSTNDDDILQRTIAGAWRKDGKTGKKLWLHERP